MKKIKYLSRFKVRFNLIPLLSVVDVLFLNIHTFTFVINSHHAELYSLYSSLSVDFFFFFYVFPVLDFSITT